MQLKNYAFNKLPFSKLFTTYTDDFEKTADFFETNPFRRQAIKTRAEEFRFSGNRATSAALLKEFNNQFNVDTAALTNIDRLKEDDALAIVTGQQLGLYGGPLYTIYKTVTTINLARIWERRLNRPVIPVFWLADEDHDYDEVNSIQVIAKQGLTSLSLPKKTNNFPPVSELSYSPEILEIRSTLQSALYETDFSNDLWALLDDCFKSGESFLHGFGSYIARLFSKHGLILAGSDHPGIKKQLQQTLVHAVQHADELRGALESQSQKIGQQFHQQASVYDSHLFYLHSDEGRLKIHQNGAQWETDAGQEWTIQELVSEIELHPQRFSPDVFLRPVLQDRLLPTLGYVAGPGEVAYYGQMKTFYHCFDQQMPVIFPRLSVTLIEPAIDRIITELPFDFNAYSNRIEDLESEYVYRTEQTNIEDLFKHWRAEVESVSVLPISKVASIDETLEGAAQKVQSTYFNEMDKLKGKVYRAVKKHDKIQLKRIRRIQQNLFPERNLQERTLNAMYYMNKFGIDIWDKLLDEMDESLSLNTHILAFL